MADIICNYESVMCVTLLPDVMTSECIRMVAAICIMYMSSADLLAARDLHVLQATNVAEVWNVIRNKKNKLYVHKPACVCTY